MAKGPAKVGRIGDLHNKITEIMLTALEQIELAQAAYDPADENAIVPPEVPAPLLSVMVKFVKDNNVTCAPEEGNTMSELQTALEAKRAKRKARVGNVVPFIDTDE
ncbi:hypothetical protein [Pannonibacter sp. SL95]|uniref:hypothetical protein n=1 Tax=Pannonibacter sp. SL95 TaxID=2995153 RepID=UPI0022731841|nr:hypothetical protein [Pannonibacter sp. SL95]MCY1708353.1 hypothetical protein [Pannonibacter sp. SL95]